MLKIVATRATRMPVSPAAWSSSSRMSLGGGEGGGGEVVLAVDGDGGGEVVLAVDDIGGDAPHRDKLLTCGANDIHWLCSP